MTWGTNHTWTVGEILTAALFNLWIRDQLAETAPAKVTTAGDVVYATGAGALTRLGSTPGGLLGWNTAGTALEAKAGGREINGALLSSMGGGVFPYNGASTTDVTISANTTWTTADYPNRIVKLRKLTINAGIVLTLGSPGVPWFIFVDEIAFGDTSSEIRIDGNNTTSGGGGRGTISGTRYGGRGGGAVLIVARLFSGSNGLIRARGEAGSSDATAANADGVPGAGGPLFATFDSSASTFARYWTSPTAVSYATDGRGAGIPPQITYSVSTAMGRAALLQMLVMGFTGGRGGLAYSSGSSPSTGNYGNGGDGGLIWCIVGTYTATPTCTVTGGAGMRGDGSASSPAASGAAGLAVLDTMPAA